MRVKHLAVLALVVCLCPVLFAQTPALNVSPARFQPFDEAFLTVFVAGLTDTDLIQVTMSGPAGTFTVEPSYVDGRSIIVWVPQVILQTQGQYSVNVTVTRATGVLNFGPGFFSVAPAPPDQIPPQLAFPEVVVVEAVSLSGAIVNYSVTAHDGSAVNCNRASGSQFPLGGTLVRCSASNAHGTVEIEFAVFVVDNVSPVLTVPANIVTENPVVTFTATATDNLDPDPDVFCFPASGQSFPKGTTTVNCFAIDHFANADFDSFTVTVNVAGAPVLTLPDDQLVEATSPDGAAVNFTATATENATVACTPPSGSTFPIGTTTVNCTATNANGSASGSFTVTVKDSTPPVIVAASASPDSLWPPDHKMVAVTILVTAVDAGDAAPVTRIIDVSSNQPVNGGGDGDTAPDWEITGPLTLNLRAERTGTQDRVYSIWIQAVDATGNFSTRKVEVRVSQSKRRSSQ